MLITDKIVLREKSINTSLEECLKLDLFNEMDSVCSAHKGAGMAAIQIGIPLRACIIRSGKLKLNMINPIITETYYPTRNPQEGCLSLPGINVDTQRHKQVNCKFFDAEEMAEKKAAFYGFEAIAVQHEVDHMDGILITDRVAKKTMKIGRNDPCPCGSGKKYKKCCMNKSEAK